MCLIIIKILKYLFIQMNEIGSLFLATLVLAVGGVGLYVYKTPEVYEQYGGDNEDIEEENNEEMEEKYDEPEIIETKIYFTNKEYIYHYTNIDTTYIPQLKEIDLLILAEKDQNSKLKLSDIAKKYKLHRNTVSNRWNNMWADKVIYKKALELTPSGYDFVDLGLKSFIILKAKSLTHEHIINELKKTKMVQDLFTTLSNEIVIIIRTKNSDELATFYRQLAKLSKSIIRSDTIIFLTKKTKAGLNVMEVKQLLAKTNNL